MTHHKEKETDIIIRKMKMDPELVNPEHLTESIMEAIGEAGRNKSESRIIKTATRLLAAASVLLILVLGIEQYIVVNKIARLENENTTPMISTIVKKPYLLNYNTGLSLDLISNFAQSFNMKSRKLSIGIKKSRLSAVAVNQFNNQLIYSQIIRK